MSLATQTMNGNTLATEIKPRYYESAHAVFRLGVDPMDELKHYTYEIHFRHGKIEIQNNEIVEDTEEACIECADFDELIEKANQLQMTPVNIHDIRFFVVADLECEDIKETYLYTDFDWICETIDNLEAEY